MGKLIVRERYMKMLRAGRGLLDVVKVVTGMRRSGKSTLLDMFSDELVSQGVPEEDIVRIDFETFEYRDVRTRRELDGILLERIGTSGTRYVFLDELQNVEGWEESVSSLINTKRCDVYITGSNSKMLSSDLVTHIAGRFVEITVLPFSFAEYLELHPGDRAERFNQFLRYGALPEVDPDRGEAFCDSQLRGVFNTVLVDDTLSRLRSADANTLRAVARFLYANIGNVTSIDSVANALGYGNDTVKRYVTAMTDAFLFFHAERYDIVGKRVLKTNGKYYASDLGLRAAALLGAGGTDVSRPLENVVYLELVRRGYTVRVGSFRDREVDFTAVRDGATEYFQVCLTMLSEGTRDRELRSLESVRDNFPKTVLTLDSFGLGDENGIRIANVLDWLLEGEDRASPYGIPEGSRLVGIRRRPPDSTRSPDRSCLWGFGSTSASAIPNGIRHIIHRRRSEEDGTRGYGRARSEAMDR